MGKAHPIGKTMAKKRKLKRNKTDKEYNLWEHRKKAGRKSSTNKELLSDLGISIAAYLNWLALPILLIVIFILFHDKERYLWLGLFMLLYGVEQYCGYLFKWRFVFCSYQILHKMNPTPDCVDWKALSKSDIYGFPSICAVMGSILIIVFFIL